MPLFKKLEKLESALKQLKRSNQSKLKEAECELLKIEKLLSFTSSCDWSQQHYMPEQLTAMASSLTAMICRREDYDWTLWRKLEAIEEQRRRLTTV